MLTAAERTKLRQAFEGMPEGDCKAWVRERARGCGLPQAMLDSMDEYPDYMVAHCPDPTPPGPLDWALAKSAAEKAQALRKQNSELNLAAAAAQVKLVSSCAVKSFARAALVANATKAPHL